MGKRIGMVVFFVLFILIGCTSSGNKDDNIVTNNDEMKQENYRLRSEITSELIDSVFSSYEKRYDKFSKTNTYYQTYDNDKVDLSLYLKYEVEEPSIPYFFIFVSYMGDDWVFMKNIQFLIDDESIKVTFNREDISRDVLDGGSVFESCSIYPILNDSFKKVLESLSRIEPQPIDCRLSGTDGIVDFTISAENIEGIVQFYSRYNSIW